MIAICPVKDVKRSSRRQVALATPIISYATRTDNGAIGGISNKSICSAEFVDVDRESTARTVSVCLRHADSANELVTGAAGRTDSDQPSRLAARCSIRVRETF